jgi:hypothetical protein
MGIGVQIESDLDHVAGGKPDSAVAPQLNGVVPEPWAELLKQAEQALGLIERVATGKEWGAIEEYAEGLHYAIENAKAAAVNLHPK